MSKQKVMIGNVCSATEIEIDTGNGGGAGTVIVDDNGVTIVPAASTLNFTGAGVAVTPGGPGEANIAVSGTAANPAGTNNDVQFNEGGAFAADTGVFTYTPGPGPNGEPGTMHAPEVSTESLLINQGATITVMPTIFANSTGNDSTGDGTTGNPYRTFYRALQDVEVESYNKQWYIDITNLGTETVTNPFTKTYRSNVVLQGTSSGGIFPGVTTSAAINVLATPIAQITMGPGDIVSTALQANTNLITVTVSNGPFTPSQFAGMFLVDASNNVIGITDNTSTTITLATAFGNTGLTAPFTIYTQSARLESSSGVTLALIGGTATFIFAGIGFNQITSGNACLAIAQSNNSSNFFIGCNISSLSITDPAGNPFQLTDNALVFSGCNFSSSVNNTVVSIGASPVFVNCTFNGITDNIRFVFGEPVMAECSVVNSIGIECEADIQINNTSVTGAIASAIAVIGPCNSAIANSFFSSTNDNGIIASEAGCNLFLNNVGGTGNPSVGLSVSGGASVVTSSPMSITGTAGDFVLGAGIVTPRSWVNYYSAAPLMHQYDMFGDQSSVLEGANYDPAYGIPSIPNVAVLGNTGHELASIATTAGTIINAPTTSIDIVNKAYADRMLLFTNINDVAIANTSAPVSIFDPSGVGNLTIPAGFFSTPKTLHLTARGWLNVDTGNPNIGIIFSIGGVFIASVTPVSITVGSVTADGQFEIDFYVTGRSATTVMGTGFPQLVFTPATPIIQTFNMLNGPPPGAVVTLPTLPAALDCTFQWGTASPQNSLTISNLTLTVDN